MALKKMEVLFLEHLIMDLYLLKQVIIMEEVKEKPFLLNLQDIMIILILKNVQHISHKKIINMQNIIYSMKILLILFKQPLIISRIQNLVVLRLLKFNQMKKQIWIIFLVMFIVGNYIFIREILIIIMEMLLLIKILWIQKKQKLR